MAVVIRGPPLGIKDIEASKALRWALLGLVGCHVAAGPDLQSLPLWTCTGLMIGIRLAPRAVPVAPPAIPIPPGLAPVRSLPSARLETEPPRIGWRSTGSIRSEDA
jgi:hypothetical protein